MPGFKSVALFLLAIVFSIALMFAFIELPFWIDGLLSKNVGFPGFDQGIDDTSAFKTKIYIDALYLRWIGYISLILVLLFIILGFATKKTGWAWAGAVTLFLPVFGQFALSMFFLSGLGILRAGWLPFMDISWSLLDLGKIIYIPYWLLLWFFNLFNWYAHDFISWFLMSTGAFLFGWGVVVWFQTKFARYDVATRWIYRISRHPQYLGWIIWSYGLMLFSSDINNMKKTWSVPSSLPWLLMTMVIIAICLIEEIKMKEQSGDDYVKYQINTPFLFPIPKWLKKLLKSTIKLFFKKEHHGNLKEVIGITGLYTVIFIILSLIWVFPDIFQFPDNNQTIGNQKEQIASIVSDIQQNQSRRTLSGQFESLIIFGEDVVDELLIFLDDQNPDKREFAAQSLGKIKAERALPYLVAKINDPNFRVSNEAIMALGRIGSREAIPALRQALNTVENDNLMGYILNALTNLGDDSTWPFYVERLDGNNWYERTAALNALYQMDHERSLRYVYNALNDIDANVRRNAVIILLKQKHPDAQEYLKEVIDDQDFESRFYARQALKTIQQKYNR